MGINFTIQFLIQFDTFHFEIKFDYTSLHDELENPKNSYFIRIWPKLQNFTKFWVRILEKKGLIWFHKGINVAIPSSSHLTLFKEAFFELLSCFF